MDITTTAPGPVASPAAVKAGLVAPAVPLSVIATVAAATALLRCRTGWASSSEGCRVSRSTAGGRRLSCEEFGEHTMRVLTVVPRL